MNRFTNRRPSHLALAVSTLAIGASLLVPIGASAGAAAACDDDWSIDADSMTIRERDESLGILGNDGDEPYLGRIPFRVRTGVKGSTKSWIQGADQEPDDDGTTGESFEIPDSMGRAVFPDVAQGEMIGVVTFAMESDASPFRDVRYLLEKVRVVLHSALASAFEKADDPIAVASAAALKLIDSSTANDAAAINSLKSYVGSFQTRLTDGLKAGVREAMPSSFAEWLRLATIVLNPANLADPDGFGGASVNVYIDITPVRLLLANPALQLLPSTVRSSLNDLVSKLDDGLNLDLAEGFTATIRPLGPEYRSTRYSYDGFEHIDADGLYEVGQTVTNCDGGIEPGTVHVDRHAADQKSGVTIEDLDWTTGWTNVESFTVNGVPHLFRLKSGSGRVEIDKITMTGSNVGKRTKVHEASWTRGWTHTDIVPVGGVPFLVHYKQSTGRFALADMTKDLDKGGRGTYDTQDLGTALWAGWTSVEGFSTTSGSYVIFHNAASGRNVIHAITSAGALGAQVHDSNLGAGWAGVDTFTIGTKTYLYLSNPRTGAERILLLNANGTVGAKQSDTVGMPTSVGVDFAGRRLETKTSSFYTVGGVTYLLRVDRVTGVWDVRSISTSGSAKLSSPIGSGRWSSGWSGLATYTVGSTAYRFLIKSAV